MSAHTPGPWAVVTDPPNDAWYAGITIFCVSQHTRVADACCLAPEYRANARLIAAAPTMLAALKTLRENYRNDSEHARLIDAALREAEGGT